MKEYTIAIEETIVQEFKVTAENADEALEIAEAKYKSKEFVLEDAEAQFVQMSVITPENEATEWVEV